MLPGTGATSVGTNDTQPDDVTLAAAPLPTAASVDATAHVTAPPSPSQGAPLEDTEPPIDLDPATGSGPDSS